jgi:hypothetical protein
MMDLAQQTSLICHLIDLSFTFSFFCSAKAHPRAAVGEGVVLRKSYATSLD